METEVGEVSGHKLNKSKSSIIFLNELESESPPKIAMQFKRWREEAVTFSLNLRNCCFFVE